MNWTIYLLGGSLGLVIGIPIGIAIGWAWSIYDQVKKEKRRKDSEEQRIKEEMSQRA